MTFDKNSCGRWGEADTEKGPADLFPAEPTDEQFTARRPWTWVQGPFRIKRASASAETLFMRKMGLERNISFKNSHRKGIFSSSILSVTPSVTPFIVLFTKYPERSEVLLLKHTISFSLLGETLKSEL